MSEQVLEAIVRLLAIIASHEGVARSERAVMEQYLSDNLDESSIAYWMRLFDKTSASQKNGKEEVVRICTNVNRDLSLKQKIVIMVKLTELAFADKSLTEMEEEYLITACSSLNIPYDWFFSIKQFMEVEEAEELITSNILIISNRPQPEEAVCKYIHDPKMTNSLAVIYFPSADLYFLRYFPRAEDLYLNGYLLQPHKIYLLPSGSAIKGETTEPIFFSEIASRFAKESEETPITLEARDVSYFYKGKAENGIQNINVREESGSMVAIMGASGAGKSTLLNVLNGNLRPQKGSVKINGMDLHAENSLIKGVIGFVPQEDLLIEELTVYENLYYVAKLSFEAISKKDAQDLVDETLQSLGLYEIRDNRVGGVLDRSISGGQRKRLNIGLELLRKPSLLFVDEPTSGLSSRDSENIIDLLRQLSRSGKLVMTVIHQPSSVIFKQFDRVFLLDQGGYPIYYGNPIESVIYFKKEANMINAERGVCPECGTVNPEQIFNIVETRVVDELGNATGKRRTSPARWNELFEEKVKLPEVKNHEVKPGASFRKPSLFTQFQVFTARDIKAKLNNTQYLLINLLQAPALALVLAYIMRYYRIDESDFLPDFYRFADNVNIPGYIFVSVIVALFMGLVLSAEEIIKDRRIRKRESFLDLSEHSYLSSKVLILFMVSAIQVLLYVWIGNAILEIQAMNWRYWFVLFTAACFSNMLGLNISATLRSPIAIYISIPIILIPQMILGGLVVKYDEINPKLTTPGKVPFVSDLMTSRWAFESLIVSQFRDNPLEEKLYPYDRDLANAEYKSSYLMPKLSSKYEYVHDYFDEKRNEKQKFHFANSLRLLRNELGLLLQDIPQVKFEQLNQLYPAKYNSEVDLALYKLIRQLKNEFSKDFRFYNEQREHFVSSNIQTAEAVREYRKMQREFINKKVGDLAKNTNSLTPLVEYNGHFIRKIFPVFRRPQPEHLLDYRAPFYAPQKFFLGAYHDTFWFNCAVVWFFSVLFYLTLYYRVFRKLLDEADKHILKPLSLRKSTGSEEQKQRKNG